MDCRWIVILTALLAGACESGHSAKLGAKAAWASCLFELDKVEAIRGRNLDDLNKGGTNARNQFMMDCMWTHGQAPQLDQLRDMSEYLARTKDRLPGDLNLNNGKR